MPSVASSADRLAFLIPPPLYSLLPIIESLMCVVRIHEMLNTVSTCRLICQTHKRTGVVGTVYRGELMYAQQCQFKLNASCYPASKRKYIGDIKDVRNARH